VFVGVVVTLRSQDLGYHQHLVSMIACITVTEPVCLVIEFCQLGDLCHLLRREKENIIDVRRKTQCWQQIISAERRQFAVYERSVVVFMASR
jgi:hypothetical protein